MPEDWSSILKQDLKKLSEVAGIQPVKTELLIPGERRDVAILFLDLKDFTAMSETMDHEMVHKIVGGIMQALLSVVKGHGGYVDKIEGDQIMALFGAEEATDNDCIRAVACGLKMFDVIREVNQIFSAKGYEIGARCGINYGSVTVAPDATGHTTAIGDEVNLASRMESTAEVNTVQVTARVQKECGDSFDWEDLGEKIVKGKKKPVHTFHPTGPGSVQKERWERAARVLRSPMVGREKEMDILQSWWDKQTGEAEKNRRGGAKHFVIGISAEAGIGKSRLVHEFIKSRTDDFVLLKGQTLSYAQPPFWLWITLLRKYFGIGSGDQDAKQKFDKVINTQNELRDSAPFLAELLSISSDDPRLIQFDDQAKYQETQIALRNLVRSIGRKRGRVVLILEDLHWLESSSRDAFKFIISNCDTEIPVLILCLYRPGEETILPKVHENYIISDEITLSPIDEESCRRLIGFMLDSSSTEAEDFLLKQSQGNPFFLEELILDMIESGSLKETENRWELATEKDKITIPTAMSGLLRSRIDRLPPAQKSGLQHSSVIGMEFLLKMYRRVKDKLETSGEAEEILAALEKHEFINSLNDSNDSKYIFKHILLHNTTYDTILHHNRAILHRYAAEATEELFPDELESLSGIIANHYDRAGDNHKTIEWGIKALIYCRKTYQNEEGLRWAKRLTERLEVEPESLERDEEKLTVWSIAERIQELLGRSGDRRESIESMLVVCERWELKRWMGIVRNRYGDLCLRLGQKEEAQVCFQQALDIYLELGDRGGEATVLHQFGILHHTHGNTEEAVRYTQRSLNIFMEISDRGGEGGVLNSLGKMYRSQDRMNDAQHCFQRALKISQDIGHRLGESIVLHNLGYKHYIQGRQKEALNCYRLALDIRREVGDRRGEGGILGSLANLNRDQGRNDEALKYYRKSLEIFHEINDSINEADFLAGLGILHLARGSRDEAMECYRQAFALVESNSVSRNLASEFVKLHRQLIEVGIAETELPFPIHWEKE